LFIAVTGVRTPVCDCIGAGAAATCTVSISATDSTTATTATTATASVTTTTTITAAPRRRTIPTTNVLAARDKFVNFLLGCG